MQRILFVQITFDKAAARKGDIMKKLFTSESVTEGHPDKICDIISDSILDAIIAEDKNARVACETTATTGVINIFGEITTTAWVDMESIVRECLRNIGYDRAKYGFDCDTCAVISSIHKQSPDIALGVDRSLESKKGEDKSYDTGAGDQGMMFGYACDETQEYMPLPISLAHKMANAMKEIGLDCEYAILNNKKKVTGNKETAREMGGVPYFLKTNILANGGTKRDLTYELLNDAIEQVFNCGGNPNVIVASGRNKRVLSGLIPLNTERTQQASSRRMVHTIDIFEGDFGRQRVMTNRWMSNDEVYVLSEEYLKKAYLRPFKKADLPKKASATEKIIEGEWTLEVRAEKAHAVIRDLNGTLPTA